MIRVVVVDDHTLVRQGVCRLLVEAGDIEVAGEASSGDAAVSAIVALRPDVVVLDLSMPDRPGAEAPLAPSGGLEVMEAVRHRLGSKAPPVVVLSMLGMMDAVRAALREGAVGYVVKQSATPELVAAVRAAATGSIYLSAEVAQVLAASSGTPSSSPADRLSPREREVVRHVADGRSSKEIAALLHTSPKTVEKQRRDAMRKLDVSNVASLVRKVLEHDL